MGLSRGLPAMIDSLKLYSVAFRCCNIGRSYFVVPKFLKLTTFGEKDSALTLPCL